MQAPVPIVVAIGLLDADLHPHSPARVEAYVARQRSCPPPFAVGAIVVLPGKDVEVDARARVIEVVVVVMLGLGRTVAHVRRPHGCKRSAHRAGTAPTPMRDIVWSVFRSSEFVPPRRARPRPETPEPAPSPPRSRAYPLSPAESLIEVDRRILGAWRPRAGSDAARRNGYIPLRRLSFPCYASAGETTYPSGERNGRVFEAEPGSVDQGRGGSRRAPDGRGDLGVRRGPGRDGGARAVGEVR